MPAVGFSQGSHTWQNSKFPWELLTYRTCYVKNTLPLVLHAPVKPFCLPLNDIESIGNIKYIESNRKCEIGNITTSIFSQHVQCHFLIEKFWNSSLLIAFSVLNSHLSILDLGLPVSFSHFFLQKQHQKKSTKLIISLTVNIKNRRLAQVHNKLFIYYNILKQ